jgi:hypothetical protein
MKRRSKVTGKNHRAGLYRELESRGFVKRKSKITPSGGVALRPVRTDLVNHYLGDTRLPPGARPRRDPRSYLSQDRRGKTIDPTLLYFTFVNFSKAYKANSRRECFRRRLPGRGSVQLITEVSHV